MTRRGYASVWIVVCLLATVSAQESALSIVRVGPEGELASRDQANEIRVVFSEPMVTLGRIPDVVTAPYVHISPSIRGTFRWSGTTILIFTPDPKRPLPFATRFEITVDRSAKAVSGRRLARAETFRFTTPTVRLLRTHWYRRGSTADGQMVILLRFNQPVRPADVAAHTSATLQGHFWSAPVFAPEERERLQRVDPTALDRFAAKVKRTEAIAAGGGAVTLRLTDDWDKESFPSSSDLVAFEAVTRVEPESWVRVALDSTLPSPAGAATPPGVQDHTIQVERAFFVDGFRCTTACDADMSNPVRLRSAVEATAFASAVRAVDITRGERSVSRAASPKARENGRDALLWLTLEDAGYESQPPDTTYAVTAAADLESADGQTLGYTWLGIVGNWNMTAFTSFGDGHGVWERDGGPALPFHARNMTQITQWAAPVLPSDLMPTLRTLEQSNFRGTPEGVGTSRTLPVTPNRVQAHGLDLGKALQPGGTGIVWSAIRDGKPLERSRAIASDSGTTSSLVQVTNLGISVKDSPQNTLIFVTQLDTGAPVANASVSIVRLDNTVHWRGETNGDGVAMAPDTSLRSKDTWWHELAFIVIAEKDGDVAYAASNWNEGILPWDFGLRYDLHEAAPILRGSVFTDRGVYRLGEEVHFKAILRRDTPSGIQLLRPGSAVNIVVRDSQNRVVDERKIAIGEWSSAEWTLALPENGALGSYRLQAALDTDSPAASVDTDPDEEFGPAVVWTSFLVAAYRRPDFRVDVTLTAPTAVAGEPLTGVVSGRYLFGAPLGPRPVTWRFSRSPVYRAPASITATYGDDRWVFVGMPSYLDGGFRATYDEIRRADEMLGANGQLALNLETARDAGVPCVYSLEGDVEDVSRQHIANRAAMTVHPAPWYVGVRRPSYFIDQKDGLSTEIVAVGLDGRPAAGVPVEVSLTQIQWRSVRRAEGNGFYTWDSERLEVPSGTWTIASASEPVALKIPFTSGGYFILKATGRSSDGRSAVTTTSFYVLGSGYTAWRRFDHNRIELVPERQSYKPGETARIMIQSPWEQATALVTTEREGIRTYRQFALTSTQQSIDVPIAETDIPNVFVSVLLIKGRTAAAVEADTSDPGKPSFRLGYLELNVDDTGKRLTLAVTANREEYRPASDAHVSVVVKDPTGAGVSGEVTLWAVDYGVLSLTAYQTPDVLPSVYVRKALQVANEDTRQRIVSRRVLTPKGANPGGGGGADGAGSGTRTDFRVLAFWLGSVVTDATGQAQIDVKLPESLTTYRVMAVASDRASRFGAADLEIRTNKPLTLKSTFPRFLAVNDTAHFGAVLTSQLKATGNALVTMKSLDPSVLEIAGGEQTVTVPAGGALEVRFQGVGRAIGRARVRVTAAIGEETDAFEDIIPVEVQLSPETVAAYGEVGEKWSIASETLTPPAGVVPSFGGLRVELSSTAMVGLAEGARYLVEYPYGCAEQKGSRALALLLTADLGDAFTLPGMDTARMRPAVQDTLKDLERYQCSNGGFAYWPGQCLTVSPYLTSYLLHVFKVASDLKYDVNPDMRRRAVDYLERQLNEPPPQNAAWWPSYSAWQAFAVKVLVESGRNQDSNVNRLFGYRDRMPVFALAYLHDAMLAKGERSGTRISDLERRMSNAILPEAGSAHVEELSDPYLLWFWNSNVRSTAIVLNAFLRGDDSQKPIRELVRWMMQARKDGRWGNTQENALALESLVAYYRKHEAVTPNFRAIVRLGQEVLAAEEFRGRSTDAITRETAMPKILAAGAGKPRQLTFSREGAGTLFYSARLRYAADTFFQRGLDAGFQIARRYEPFVESGPAKPAATTFKAGDLVRVTLTFRLTKERRFVAVTDPVPAGFEAVESWFDSTARSLAASQDDQSASFDIAAADTDGGMSWWRHGGFDHVERHDDRIQLFATRLSEGMHEFSYIARATTAGTFRTAPARAEEMYEPEIFGRTATTVIEVKR